MPTTSKLQPGDPPLVDPTLLTMQMIDSKIASLRELFDAKSNELDRMSNSRHLIVVARLDERDKAIDLAKTEADKFPCLVDEKISSLREIHEEKFASVQTQFKERDVRTESTAKDSKVAVDAALQAAKEAVSEQNKSSALAIGKSENSTVKQIDQLAVLIQTMSKAFDDKIGDIKDRITRIEGKDEGVVKTVSSSQSNSNIAIGAIGLIVALLIGIATVTVMVLTKHGG